MIKLNNNKAGEGVAYVGTASFDGKTLRDVLEEIKEFAKDKNACYLGGGFGNTEGTGNWRISINGDIYLTSWLSDEREPKCGNELNDAKVEEVEVDGGWYCFYNFNIITNK